MKYVVMQEPETGVETIFVFPRGIHHDAIAEVLGGIKNQTHGNWHRVNREPVSAGFVDADGTCYGESESLGMASRPQDTLLLAKAQNAF